MEHEIKGGIGAVKAFVKAGHAIFTLTNDATGKRFTYRVNRPEDGNCFFVSVLTGADNTRSYSYAGIIDGFGGFRTTKASKLSPEAPSVVAFRWLLDRLVKGAPLPGGVRVLHRGKCGRCGRPLTVPESIDSGIGPVCNEKG